MQPSCAVSCWSDKCWSGTQPWMRMQPGIAQLVVCCLNICLACLSYLPLILLHAWRMPAEPTNHWLKPQPTNQLCQLCFLWVVEQRCNCIIWLSWHQYRSLHNCKSLQWLAYQTARLCAVCVFCALCCTWCLDSMCFVAASCLAGTECVDVVCRPAVPFRRGVSTVSLLLAEE